MDLPYRATAFGLDWRSDIDLPGFDPVAARAVPLTGLSVDVHRIDALPDRGAGRPVNRGFIHDDGARFDWDDEVVFDMTAGRRIGYRPGRDWAGVPASFYSTVAALTAAWRGMIPLHACAVELDGKAVLIAGERGAGKSTLTADLLGQGARFVADDLVVLSVEDGIGVTRGRPTIRLHPDTATRIDTIDAVPVRDDPRGRWLARPRHRSTADRLDLAAILILDAHLCASSSSSVPSPPPIAANRLFAHLFRPKWIDALPMRAALMRDLLTIAMRVPVLAYPGQPGFSRDDPMAHAFTARQQRRAEQAIAAVRAVVGR